MMISCYARSIVVLSGRSGGCCTAAAFENAGY